MRERELKRISKGYLATSGVAFTPAEATYVHTYASTLAQPHSHRRHACPHMHPFFTCAPAAHFLERLRHKRPRRTFSRASPSRAAHFTCVPAAHFLKRPRHKRPCRTFSRAPPSDNFTPAPQKKKKKKKKKKKRE